MNTLEIKKNYIAENKLDGVELTSFDADAMMDQWLEQNPMPDATSHSKFAECVDKCMWRMRMAEARAVFLGLEFPLNVPAYRWNIEQAIINRNGGTMLSAGLDYVENLLESYDL